MRYQELLEDFNNKGTFVGAKLSSKSARAVIAWAKKNNVPNPIQPKDMHVTILHSKETVSWDCDQYNPPLQIDPTTYHFDKFGSNEDVLILAFDSKELEARHDKGMIEHDLTWDFPNYIPHLTISNDAKDVDLSKLEMPTFPLYLIGEYKEGFDPEWKENIDEMLRSRTVDTQFLKQIKMVDASSVFGITKPILECISPEYIAEYAEIIKEKFSDPELNDWVNEHKRMFNAIDKVLTTGKYYSVHIFLNQQSGIDVNLDIGILNKGDNVTMFHPDYNAVPNVASVIFSTETKAKEFIKLLKLSFDSVSIITEAVGIIVPNVNTTVDVQPGETQRQAEKFGNKIDKDGNPPSYWESMELAAKENK